MNYFVQLTSPTDVPEMQSLVPRERNPELFGSRELASLTMLLVAGNTSSK
jgi:hypothetical protein